MPQNNRRVEATIRVLDDIAGIMIGREVSGILTGAAVTPYERAELSARRLADTYRAAAPGRSFWLAVAKRIEHQAKGYTKAGDAS